MSHLSNDIQKFVSQRGSPFMVIGMEKSGNVKMALSKELSPENFEEMIQGLKDAYYSTPPNLRFVYVEERDVDKFLDTPNVIKVSETTYYSQKHFLEKHPGAKVLYFEEERYD